MFPLEFPPATPVSFLPFPMRIAVSLNQELRTLRGGVGASWHAIAQGVRDGGAGSAWGGNPPAADSVRWEEIYRHADWLGMSWVRAEIEQRSYQPDRDRFTWESEDMLALRRILDWCESRGADVMLQQMWGNVEWNRHPDVDALHSAPLDLEIYAEGIALLADKLVRDWGYTCVRWICINNEPGCDFSWWQGPGGKPLPITPGLKAVRAALDRHDIDIPLVGPDYTGLGWDPDKADFDAFIGAFDFHTYLDEFKLMPPGMSAPEKNLKAWVDRANGQGKPLFLTEIGSMHHGWYTDSPAPGGYFANLKDVEIVLRGLHLGVEAFNRWSFNNRGDLDGQWQLVDTWDTADDALLPVFRPHPNAYWIWGMLCRFLPKYSTLLGTHVDGVIKGWQQYLLAETVRSPEGDLSVFVLTLTEQDQPFELEFEGLDAPRTFYRHRITEVMRNRAEGVRIDPDAEFPVAPGSVAFSDTAPGLSFTVYSTRRMPHDRLGVSGIRHSGSGRT
jgi:hypothetical protein